MTLRRRPDDLFQDLLDSAPHLRHLEVGPTGKRAQLHGDLARELPGIDRLAAPPGSVLRCTVMPDADNLLADGA
jgi:hypothetical protein